MIVYTPEATPAPPDPATARPTIRVVEFFDTPQIKLPTSNTNTLTRNPVFRGKYLYTLPQVDWKDATVRKKALPY
jgi:hypothetical protein